MLHSLYFVDSPYDSYWSAPSDFGVLSNVIANALGGSSVTYNLRFGTNVVALPQVASNLVQTTWDPGVLALNTTYYWQVVAQNGVGSSTGAVWRFTTLGSSGTLQFSSSSYSVLESGGSATITATRSGGSSGAVGVSYGTTNGTATSGSDYTAVSGTLSWADGDASTKSFSIPIVNDSVPEASETVNLFLRNPSGGATLGSSSNAVLTILDDDVAANLNFMVGSATGGSGAQVVVPVSVRSFSNLITFQFSMHWNPAVGSLMGIEQFGVNGLTIANFGTNQMASGTVSVSWDDPALTGVSLANGATVFALRFYVAGSAGSATAVYLTNSPTAIEAVDNQYQTVVVGTTAGQITVSSQVNLSGTVAYYSTGLGVPGVTLALTGGASQSLTNATNGTYAMSVPAGGTYALTPSKDADSNASQGISTLDIALIRRHILGLAPLDSAYKVIAADVNNSQSVSTLDLAFIRRVILGLTNNFPAGLWRFVPSSAVFTNPANPWPFDGARFYTNVIADATSQDFYAIKLGDVNNSWLPAVAPMETREATGAGLAVAFSVADQTMLPGATFAVPVTVSAFTNITSAQFSLHWNPAVVQFLGVSNFGLTGLDVGNLNTNLATNGMMGVSWDNPSGLGVSLADHTTMFTVSFQAVGANGDVSSLQFADIPTAREVTVGLAPVTFTGQAGSLTVTTAPRFTSVTRSGGRIALVWKTIPRRFYRVEYKDGATDTKWTALGTDIQAFAESVSTTDPVAPNSRFYRVSLLP